MDLRVWLDIAVGSRNTDRPVAISLLAAVSSKLAPSLSLHTPWSSQSALPWRVGRGARGEGGGEGWRGVGPTGNRRPRRPTCFCSVALNAGILPAAQRAYPVNMPDPIRIRSGWGGKHWPEAVRMSLAHWHASGPDPLGQNLTQSARAIKSDLGWFCTLIIFGRTESSLKVGKLAAGHFGSCQKPGPILGPARNRAQ